MIEIKGMTKSFGEKKVFDDFNLTIEDGEFVVFAGKSGCGKTTLLNIIGGLEPPDKGKVIVDGEDIYRKRDMQNYFAYKVGFLFQNFALVERKTVTDNLELVQKKARANMSLQNVLREVGLEDKSHTYVYKLSGGEQQRVALARLMLKKCDIILADEPTGSLDRENAENVLQILHKLNEQGKTVVLVTHSEEIMAREKRVIRL